MISELVEEHRAENQPPPASPSYTPLKDSVKLPVVLSIAAEDFMNKLGIHSSATSAR
jgi:hypothetical protein